MATTQIHSFTQGDYRTVQQAIQKRSNYIKNPDKTNEGELISSYGCSPENVDAEFALAHWQYERTSKHTRQNGVLAYQILQSFKPGEVSPDDANKIGYELATRFLKGKYPFIVCTHKDKDHIQ